MRRSTPCAAGLAVSTAVLVAALDPAVAADLDWDGSIGNWDNDASWVPGGAEPTVLDNATIDAGTVTVDLAGEVANNLIVGDTGTGVLQIDAGGNLTSSNTTLGAQLGANGTATVNGFGSVWGTGTLILGNSGDGTLNVESGGSLTSANAFVGFISGSGQATVAGIGSTWVSTNELSVGWEFNATGTLNIEAGGSVTSGFSNIGLQPGTNGSVTVTGLGSQWESGDLSVGNFGTGALSILDGGFVDSDFFGVGGSGPAATVTVSGVEIDLGMPSTLRVSDTFLVGPAGSVVVDTGGDISIEAGNIRGTVQVTGQDPGSGIRSAMEVITGLMINGAAGSLTVSDGAELTSDSGTIGSEALSNATATVTGRDTRWTNSAGLTVGDLAAGTLNVLDGGYVSSDTGVIAANPGSSGAVTVSGVDSLGTRSLWEVTNALDVQANGTLTIASGGRVTSGASDITGSVVITGEDATSGERSTWDVPGLTLNQGGSFTIEAGAEFNSGAIVGEDPGSSGTATVTGAGSTWVAGEITLGMSGTGVLNLVDGGEVFTLTGLFGLQAGSSGTTTITGAGSTWTAFDGFTVGGLGSGTMNVEAGGTATATTQTSVGDSSGSNGTINVIGPGSMLDSPTLTIGRSGTGGLNILGGGTVVGNGTIGLNAGSSGTVNVRGGGAAWTAGNLIVGSEGTGVLNVETGGMVNASGTTTIGPFGTINMLGGTLDFGTMSLSDLDRIQGSSGTLAGRVELNGLHDASILTLPNLSPLLDQSGVAVENQRLLFGSAISLWSLNNTATGEVQTRADDQLIFAGTGNLNAGEINNFGGQIRFEQDLTNQAGGVIQGRGQFIANGGWANDGVMAFSAGFADVLGDVSNSATGQIVVGGAGVTTFFDDVTMDAANLNITVASGSTAVFLGSFNGGNTGTGDVDILGDLRPGNSPAEVTFGGNLVLGSSARTTIELGGLLPGSEHDVIDVAGQFSVDGILDVVLINGFTPDNGDRFDVLDFDTLVGAYDAINLPTLAGSLEWDTSEFYTNGTLTVIAILPADLSGDGDVDDEDLGLFFSAFTGPDNGPSTNPAADLSGDGDVDDEDLGLAFSQFTGPLAPVNIPEPASLVLVAVGGMLAFVRRRV